MKLYKIRNKTTGLYSPGGSSASFPHNWDNIGKTWKCTGDARNHVTMMRDYGMSTEDMRDWELVEITYDKTNEVVVPLHRESK